MKPKLLTAYAFMLCMSTTLFQSVTAQETTRMTVNISSGLYQRGETNIAKSLHTGAAVQDNNFNKDAGSFAHKPQISFANYKPKKEVDLNDYIRLYALKASLDATKTKYKNDYYKRKAMAKFDFEAILLIAPDVVPNPFPQYNTNDVPVYEADTAKRKARSYFSFRTGLRFSGRGDKEVDGDDSYKTYVYYLTLPVYALYNYQAAGGTLFGGLGPYYGYGLFGKYIDKVSGETTKEKIKFGKDQSGLKHGDFGIGFIAGYVYNRFLVQLSYDLGLSNIYFEKDDKASNRAFGISIGYFLN